MTRRAPLGAGRPATRADAPQTGSAAAPRRRRAAAVLALLLALVPGGGLWTAPARAQAGADAAAPGAPPAAPGDAMARRGNPLWAVPLRSLSATRERPLFTPGRHPPEPPPEVAPPPPPAPAAEAGAPRPQLTLIGTIVDLRGGYAIFVEEATGATLRLRTGETHDGWVLRSVSMRDAMLQKDRATVVVALPAREIDLAAPERAPGSAPPRAAAPAAPPPPAAPKPLPYNDH